jgi:hypothetical protein
MLDAVEARLTALRARAADDRSASAFDTLRHELRAAGLSAHEFARLARVPEEALDASPEWASAALRAIALLPPSARRKLLTGPAPVERPDRTGSHPFSRIEDL